MKRGQAAIEFLTTYGFSFLIILSVVGGLFYFGIFDTANLVPSSCTLGSGVSCPIYSLEKNTTHLSATFQLENVGSDRIQITNMAIKDGNRDSYCLTADITNTTGGSLTSTQIILGSNQKLELVFEFEDGVNCDYDSSLSSLMSKLKYDLRLYYLT
jgi:hypothetical protein